jgi:hypothetical protein
MELLELDMKGPLINIAGSIPRNATQRILSLLSKDKVCSMNSFDVEDYLVSLSFSLSTNASNSTYDLSQLLLAIDLRP